MLLLYLLFTYILYLLLYLWQYIICIAEQVFLLFSAASDTSRGVTSSFILAAPPTQSSVLLTV